MMKTMVKNTGLSISENVYHTLRKNIVNLTFKPGQVLNLREITEKLEVSRTLSVKPSSVLNGKALLILSRR